MRITFLTLLCISSSLVASDIDIQGIDKVALLNALWEGAKFIGDPVYLLRKPTLTTALLQKALANNDYRVEMLESKVLEVDLKSPYNFNSWRYNDANGDGKAEEVVAALKKQLSQPSQ